LLLGFVKSLPVDGRGTGPMLVTFGVRGDLKQAYFDASMDNLDSAIRRRLEKRPLLSASL
jgi:hypothetical protein